MRKRPIGEQRRVRRADDANGDSALHETGWPMLIEASLELSPSSGDSLPLWRILSLLDGILEASSAHELVVVATLR